MKIALVAHNEKKQELLNITKQYSQILKKQELFSTKHTGMEIEKMGISDIKLFESGPDGGDIEVANMILKHDLDILIFLINPLSSHPHENDIQMLVRISNLHDVVFATNSATARVVLDSLQKHCQ
ncbi:methylglyoxal synthase [Latilactobacillus sakei]|nr:methylglyoxal synthase [Latilactobacillus sakei]AUX11679.1 methylglyoxal synthase [Latilactobacillus sakei]